MEYTQKEIERLLDDLMLVAVYGKNAIHKQAGIEACKLIRNKILEPMRKENKEQK